MTRCDAFADLPDTPKGRGGKQLEMEERGGIGPSPIWWELLPKTVGEVKQLTSVHSRFENRNLPDDFAFKTWCVVLPKAIAEETNTDASKFLIENREALGNALADDILLVTRTKGNGAIDLGFAADVKRALEYEDFELPALLFLRQPKIEIFSAYSKLDLRQLKDGPLNGIAITLGGASVDTVRRFMESLPALLEGGNVPIDLVEKLLKISKSKATKAKVGRAAKKLVGDAAEAVPTLLTIISTIFKWTGHIPGHS